MAGLMTWLEWLLTAMLVVAGDQVSKTVVLSRRPAPKVTARRQLIAIRCTLNRRGMLARFAGIRTLLLLWGIGVALALFALDRMSGHSILASIGFGAALGGATGNVLDCLRRGAIVDFIAVGWWPVFNLADAAIVTGAGLVFISLL